MIKLHLGCGKNVYDDCFNYDCNPFNDKVIKWVAGENLINPDGIMLEMESVDEIICKHMIEHIPHSNPQETVWFSFWEECWRVLKIDGKMTVTCPHGDGVWAWGDPGHIRAIYPETFFFICADNYLQALQNSRDPMTLYLPKCNFFIDIYLHKGDDTRTDKICDKYSQMTISLIKKSLPEEYERTLAKND